MGGEHKGEPFLRAVSHERLSDRQIDELIGLARGVACDGAVNQGEAEFLQKWLAANVEVSDQPVISTLYRRVNEILADGVMDTDEAADLLETLNAFSNRDFELGEVLKSTTLPLCAAVSTPAFRGLELLPYGNLQLRLKEVL